MDMSWITDRVAVGGGIWTESKMAEVARDGITHIIDMQMEFDDTALAEPFGIEVLWNPTDDDFRPKAAEVFQRGVEFAVAALDEPESKIYIHCAAGVHRGPMMTLALLRVLGFSLEVRTFGDQRIGQIGGLTTHSGRIMTAYLVRPRVIPRHT